MATDQKVSRWSVEGRHVTCQQCGETFTDYGRDGGGCPTCAATRRASAKLKATEIPQEEAVRQTESTWWFGIPAGTPYFGNPQDAADYRNVLGYFETARVEKWTGSIWVFGRRATGNVAEVPSPIPSRRAVFVSESLEYGARRRKSRVEAEQASRGI